MKRRLPDLSRFEMQCLQRLAARGEATAREVQSDLPAAPGYSTVRKILERLEEKGAVKRVRLAGRAWVYRPEVSVTEITRREIRRLLDSLFDGTAAPLMSHLADMQALTTEDLRELEKTLAGPRRRVKKS